MLPYPKSIQEKTNINQNANNELINGVCNYHRDDEQIGIELITNSEEQLKQIKYRYIRCSSQLTIGHLKKFISNMLYKTMDKHKDVGRI